MSIHIEIFAFCQSQAHGAIWLDNGTAIPMSMPIEAYETALANGIFKRLGDQEDLYPDTNGVLNESPYFFHQPVAESIPQHIQDALNTGDGTYRP